MDKPDRGDWITVVQVLYAETIATSGYLRIGELSRRVGVSPELLRAWERRYALLEPERSPGGFRLYSDAHVARIRAMQGHLARGLSAAEAARLVGASGAGGEMPERPAAGRALAELRASVDGFDEAGAQAALDGAFSALTLDAVLEEVVLPFLRELGEGWERGEVTVAQEHFASAVVRGRLLALGRGWDRGPGPRALLAAPQGELHDLGLVAFGLALRARGWRITFLGADTPLETVAGAAELLQPRLVVLAALAPERFEPVRDELRALARRWPLALAGPEGTADVAAAVGASHLPGGPVEAAEELATRTV